MLWHLIVLLMQVLLKNGFVSGRGTSYASGSAMVSGGIKLPTPKPSTGGGGSSSGNSSGNSTSTTTTTTTTTTKTTGSSATVVNPTGTTSTITYDTPAATSAISKTIKSSAGSAAAEFQDLLTTLFSWIAEKIDYLKQKIDDYISRAEAMKDIGEFDKSEKYYRSAISTTYSLIGLEKKGAPK